MLLNWIEQTRKKPKAVRNQYAFLGAVIVTACITLIWSLSLPTRFETIGQLPEEKQETSGAFAQFLGKAKLNLAAAIKARKEGGEDEVASTTEKGSAPPIVMPTLDPDTIEDVQDDYEESLLPAPREVLIETTSAQHTNASTTAE